MKPILLFLFAFFFLSCEAPEEDDTFEIEQIFVENPERIIKVNIFYIESQKSSKKSSYSLDEADYINYLNGYYFHRLGIGLELDQSRSIVNDDLYDLRDNQGGEPSMFLMQSKRTYNKNMLNIYIIKRSNIYGIAGIGRDKRVLITDQHLYTSSSPHEIGHALGLFHNEEHGNIMNCGVNKNERRYFNKIQEDTMKKQIDNINFNN